MSLHIEPIPAFEDNYIWAIHDKKHVVLVDPGDAVPSIKFIEKNKLTLTTILITHHHHDHIGGVEELLSYAECGVYAPIDSRIPFKNKIVKENDLVHLPELGISLQVIETPGHTLSHVCFYNDEWLFCGDTLFSMGCGRMFEGTAEQFVDSLKKIKSLSENLEVYCTHEYTLSNLAFALSLEPENKSLQTFHNKTVNIRQQNKPSLPSLLKTEKSLNPFLRTDEPLIQDIMSKQSNTKIKNEIVCFAKMRQLKDVF